MAFDGRGFVDWRDVVAIVHERYDEVSEGDIRAVVTDAQKKRFEIEGERVRATYGHSFPVDLGREAAQPPPKLFYGAARDIAQSMLRNGLRPRDRQYVHLSMTAEQAESVARRHDPAPAIIVVDTEAARAEGIQFYQSGPLFLAEHVPAKFLSLN